MSQFPYFKLSGTPEEIGHSAGTQFGDRIRKNYLFYEQFFCDLLKIDPHDSVKIQALKEKIEKIAHNFSINVKKIFPRFDAEIHAMATAAKLSAWQIYALNSRTEIYRILMQKAESNLPCECTSLYFPESKVLGQNWDWHPALEDLCIINKIQLDSGKSFIMFTEPGIIGKIGLNSDGLGVCLNILFAECEIKGIPIHIILRGVLECSSVAEAKTLIETLPRGTSSNLLIADVSGQAIDLELRGESITSVSLAKGELIHTNHYLNEEESASASLPGSVQRLHRAKHLYDRHCNEGASGMQQLLCDNTDINSPICRQYSMGLDFLVGTVASITMSLQTRELLVFKGQPEISSTWTTYRLM